MSMTRSTTTVKLRVIGRQQQLLRIDFRDDAVTHEMLRAKLAEFEQRLPECDAVSFSDYGKGRADAHRRNDPSGARRRKDRAGRSEGRRLRDLRRGDVITPNRSEMREVVGRWKDEEDLEQKANGAAQRTDLRRFACHAQRGRDVAVPRRPDAPRKGGGARGFDVSGPAIPSSPRWRSCWRMAPTGPRRSTSPTSRPASSSENWGRPW